MDTDKLTQQIIAFRNKRWKDRRNSAKNMAIWLNIEATEFLEIFKETSGQEPPKGKKRLLEEELVDVLYWVLLIAYDLKINLGKAFDRKMKKNMLKYPV